MSIRIFTKNKTLAATLRLEALRRGFCEEGEPSILFADLDTAPVPTDVGDNIAILLSSDPERLAPYRDHGTFDVMHLPFSVRDFADILHRYGTKSQKRDLQKSNGAFWLNGRRLELSPTENAILELLYEKRGQTVSDGELSALLGSSAERTNTAAVYLYRLRRKLCADGINRIRTLRGRGYCLTDSETLTSETR